MSRKLAIILWWIITFGAFSLAYAAPSTKYDGTWTLGIHRNCDKTDNVVIIIVKDGKLASSQIFLDIDGKIRDNGSLTIVASYNGVNLYSTGHLSATEGSGEWHTESAKQSCSGRWKAIKNK